MYQERQLGKGAKHEHPQSSSVLTPESSEEGYMNKVIWSLAEQCLNEYNRKLDDLNCRFDDLQDKSQLQSSYSTYPLLTC